MPTLESLFSYIDKSLSIAELYESEALPQVNYEDEYFFVSYSHDDYRFVYKDILRLQNSGIMVWYDRGMRPGKDWDETAEHFISSFACKGVLLYLGVPSFSSRAVLKEIALAKKYDKPLIPLVIKPDYLEDNDIALTYLKHASLSKQEKELVTSSFSKKTLWIDASFPVEQKKNYIENLKDDTPVIEVVEFSKGNNTDMVPNLDIEEGKIAINLNNRSLHQISLPEGVNFVYKVAFTNSSNLESLDLSKVVSIDDYAFSNCRKLKEVALGQLGYLGLSCFEGCTSLSKVTFLHNPNKDVEDYLAALKAFDEIKIDDDYTEEELAQAINELSMENGAEAYELYDQENFPEHRFKIGGSNKKAGLLENCKRLFAGCSSLMEFEIPLNLFYTVPEECFLDCSSLRLVKANNIDEIGPGAFRNCSSLTKFFYPDGFIEFEDAQRYLKGEYDVKENKHLLTKIGSEAFYGCKGLERFPFPLTLRELGDRAFAKSGLVGFYIGSLNKMGEAVFQGCEDLEEAYLDCYSINELPDYTFRGCKKLSILALGKMTQSIGKGAFYACSSLEGFGDLRLSILSKIGEDAFRRSGLRSFSLVSGSSMEIHSGAFASCHNLEELKIGRAQTFYIDEDAFLDTPKLKDILLPYSVVAHIDFKAFPKTVENLFYPGDEEEFNKMTRIEFSTVYQGFVGRYPGEFETPEERKPYLEKENERLQRELRSRLRFLSKEEIKDGFHWHYNEEGKPELY